MAKVPPMLEAALVWVERGFPVFPVKPDKKPITEHGLLDATKDTTQVTEWWKKWPIAGIAIPTDGLIVLDCDPRHNGLEDKANLEEKYQPLPATRTHQTGGGGLHLLYRNPNGSDIRNTVALDGFKGLDIRANGGYIVVPPSLHESGNRYAVKDKTEIAPAPDWLVTLLKARQAKPPAASATPEMIPEGQRNQRLFKVAASLRRQGMTQEAILAALKEVNVKQCNPPLAEAEVAVIAGSGARYEPDAAITAIPAPSGKYLPMAEIPTPEISESIGRVTYVWPTFALRVVCDRVKEEGSSELWFYRTDNGALLHLAKANLLSTTTMAGIAKRLSAHSAEIPWAEIMTFITARTMEFCRRGEPGTVIKPDLETPKKPQYYVAPVIMQGVPNIIFGDKGVSKTTLGLACIGLACMGCTESRFGLSAMGTTKVALLDWESTQELTDFTIGRLISGDSVPYFHLPYLHGRQPLADDIERIGNFLHENDVELVLIDSLGSAAGNDKFDTSGKTAALRFFEALRQLKVTSLIIAQNAKSEEGKKTIYGSTYFTYYSRNIFELKGKKDEEDKSLHTVLMHQEGNYSGKFEPLAFHMTYTDETIRVETEEVSVSGLLKKMSQNSAVLEFLADGAKTRKAIATALHTSGDQASIVLTRLEDKGLVVPLGSGLWSLKDNA